MKQDVGESVTDDRAREIVGRLSEAQREAVISVKWRKEEGRWNPAGWYVRADKRVRLRLADHGLIPDYLRPDNRLTPLGLSVRRILQEQER